MSFASLISFPAKRHSPTFLISNISSLISVRLQNQNHLLCKSQFLPMLRANGLMGFIDGTYHCTSEFIIDTEDNTTIVPNPKHFEWVQQDQNIMCSINVTFL